MIGICFCICLGFGLAALLLPVPYVVSMILAVLCAVGTVLSPLLWSKGGED